MGVYFSIAVIFSVFFLYGSYATKLIVKNKCPHKIWPATQASQGAPILLRFELASKASQTLNVPNAWSGRIWPRYVCSQYGRNFTCLSGDCRTGQIKCNDAGGIPPATLAQFTIARWSGEKDFYSVSIVDGFNLPVSVKPINRPDCLSIGCYQNLNDISCVDKVELEVRDQHNNVIGCKSECLAFHRDDLCCTGSYSSPQTCKPSSYSKELKVFCPQAYTYPFDDALFTCTRTDYLITFCPWGQGVA
ncbi:thaumatin-like protein 1b [Lycium ferocissimum]|uniref:thaumatin-like protein 1b n=1 Tax=Lycium ferocissimum TaxID=112874 RepID=UPI002815D349|nr:thaumatin-like protein 1b [Lycium ferocissimum]